MQLPATSRFHEAMSQDEEAMRASLEANGGQMPKGSAPPLHSWTQEASLLAMLVEEMRAMKTILIKVNSKQGSAAPEVQPVQRPRSAWQKIEAEARLAKHAHLVSRLLPGGHRPPPT
jgi:hypothetical protein